MRERILCKGGDCPYRQHCWRFLQKENEQAHYFSEPPYKLIDIGANSSQSSTGKMFECDHFLTRDEYEIRVSGRSR